MTTLPPAESPFYTLPDDVLREIFVDCVPWISVDDFAEGAFPSHSSLDENYPPWTLSQVNRNWRALTLSIPKLWSTCNILDILLVRDAFQRPWLARRMDLLFRRSEPLPLDISFQTDLNLNHHRVVATLLATSTRWRCVRFGQAKPTQFNAIFHQRQFPALTHLSVSFSESRTALPTILDTPSLLHFEQDMRGGGSLVEAPWNQIVRYKSDKYNLHRITHMPRLEALYGLVGDDADPWEDDDAAAGGGVKIFTSLSSMHIMSAADHSFLPWLFSRFEFPALTTLACIYPDSHAAPDAYYLKYGYARSGIFEGIINLMGQTPGMESLHFFSNHLTWELLEELNETGEHPAVLQRLKTLYLTPVSSKDDPRYIISTLQGMGAPLEALSVYDDVKVEQEEVRGVRMSYHRNLGPWYNL